MQLVWDRDVTKYEWILAVLFAACMGGELAMGASRADDVTVGAGNQQFVHLEAVSPADYSPFELEFLDAIRKGVEAAGVSTDRVAVRLVSLFSDRPGTQATGSPDPLVTAIGDGGDRTYRVHVTPARLLAEGWKIAHPDGVDAVSRTVAIRPPCMLPCRLV